MVGPESLRGKLFPAVPVPLTSAGRLHATAQMRYVEHLGAQPIGGVAVWAHTGRGPRLEKTVRGEVLQAWRQGLPAGRLVIAAAGAPPGLRPVDQVFEAACAMARQAAELGADVVLVHPPVAFRGRSDQDRLVLEYHAALAEAGGLPLLLFYLYEAAGGVSYGPHVLAQLLARPSVLGIKVATLDSVMTFQQIAGLMRVSFPEKVLVTGEDRFLGYSLMCGADCALVGMGAACAGLQAELLESFLAGRAERFLELSRTVDVLAQHTFVPPIEGYIRRMLWCLVHQGIIPEEAAHDPWGPPLGPAEFEQIRACLERIGQLPAQAVAPGTLIEPHSRGA
jgi:4-hydroxy-tetrahydrodipicolinate synthase